MELKPIAGASFGVTVHGVDLATDLSDKTILALLQALYEHRIVVIKDQYLSEDAYLSFGQKIGKPDQHPLEHLRLAGYPEIEAIGNTQERDKDERVRNGATFWHSDQVYEQNPVSIISLYTVAMPEKGGETLLCDLYGAYEELDQATKERIDGLVVKHHYTAGGDSYATAAAPPLRTKEQQDKMAPVRHPLVLSHPHTGRKSLYAVTGFATGIEGMADEEAGELLRMLKEHVLKTDYTYKHRYDINDVTLIDQFQTLHCALPIGFTTGSHDARLLWRLGIKDAPAILADDWRLTPPPTA